MPAFAVRDDSNCPECKVRLGYTDSGGGFTLFCYHCEYGVSIAYGQRVLTIKERHEMINLLPKAKEFIQCLITTREYGFNDLCVLTHAWHETAGFVKVVGSYNFWGIKVPSRSPWNGLIAERWTHEDIPVYPNETQDQALIRAIKMFARNNARIDGTVTDRKGNKCWHVGLPQQFCDWPTCEQALLFYADLVKRLYPFSYANKKDPYNYFRGLVDGKLKWATDPLYITALESRYQVLQKDAGIRQRLQALG